MCAITAGVAREDRRRRCSMAQSCGATRPVRAYHTHRRRPLLHDSCTRTQCTPSARRAAEGVRCEPSRHYHLPFSLDRRWVSRFHSARTRRRWGRRSPCRCSRSASCSFVGRRPAARLRCGASSRQSQHRSPAQTHSHSGYPQHSHPCDQQTSTTHVGHRLLAQRAAEAW